MARKIKYPRTCSACLMRMNYIVYCELRQRNQIKYVRPVELPRPEKHDFAKHTFYSNLRLMHFGVHTNIGLVADAFFLPLSSCLHPNVQCTFTYVLNIRIAKRERMLICAIFDLTHFCHVMIYKHVLAGGTGSVLNHSKRILSQKRQFGDISLFSCVSLSRISSQWQQKGADITQIIMMHQLVVFFLLGFASHSLQVWIVYHLYLLRIVMIYLCFQSFRFFLI